MTVFFLLAACIGTWLLLQTLEEHRLPLTDDNHPDSYMKEALAIQIDPQGRLKDELSAPLLVHFPKGNTTDITAPHIILYNSNSNSPPWHITADNGRAHDGIRIVKLWNHVKLMQPEGPQNGATTLLTSSMTIFPKQQYAQTDQPVKVWQGGDVVTAKGLHANLKTGEIDLLSHTFGQYQPDTTTQK